MQNEMNGLMTERDVAWKDLKFINEKRVKLKNEKKKIHKQMTDKNELLEKQLIIRDKELESLRNEFSEL